MDAHFMSPEPGLASPETGTINKKGLAAYDHTPGTTRPINSSAIQTVAQRLSQFRGQASDLHACTSGAATTDPCRLAWPVAEMRKVLGVAQ